MTTIAANSYTEALINDHWTQCGDHSGDCTLPASQAAADAELNRALSGYIADWKSLPNVNFSYQATAWRIVWTDDEGEEIMSSETS
jgi:hypothetical protein